MIKSLLFLAALALVQAALPELDALDEDSCELLDNGCPADFDIHKLLPHEYSCWRYYSCSNGDKILMRCPRGTVFDPEEETCVSGGTDRNCINDDRSDTVEDIPPESAEIEVLPNGCPANYSISLYLPHERYCNMYYQCNFGGKLPMVCAPGTHFNPAEQACDHIAVVGCTLPGGNYVPTTTPAPAPTPAPEIDLLPNGCPRNGSINWLVPHATNCSLFYACFWGGLIQMECPGNTHFSPSLQRCESPATAGCAANPCNNPCGGSCDGTDLPCPDDNTTESPTISTTETTLGTTTPVWPDWPPGDDPCLDYFTCPPPTVSTTESTDVETTTSGTTTTTTVWPPVYPCLDYFTCPPPTVSTTESTDVETTTSGTTTTTTVWPPVYPCLDYFTCPPPTVSTTESTDVETTTSGTTTTAWPNWPPGVDPCLDYFTCPPSYITTPGPVFPENEDPNKKCEKDCNNLPWAHDDCDKYWTCNGNKAVLIVCSEGLHFNPSTNTCDFACNAGCVRESIQATSTHDGLKLYLPWNKIDDNKKELLKLLAY